ncbi:MAG: helix-turn-helix transcriptional regulator [Chloroflexota bacterium]
MKEGSKYHALYAQLQHSSLNELILTFAEIETLIQTKLPQSARKQRAWWSNRRTGAVQALAWMSAGYHAEAVDLAQEQVTFRKPGLVYNIKRDGDTVMWDAELVKALRHYMNMTQAEFAQEMGVRQPTVSEWETGTYAPKRSTSKLLSFVAERAGFEYG